MDIVELMRTFVAVAQEGSFTKGAQRLGVSNRLVSKYVAQLEDHLQVQVFNRTTRSVALTTVGRVYLDRCVPLLEQFDELQSIVRDENTELAGEIRMSAPTGYGTQELPRLLIPFLTAHPKVRLELDLSNRRVALIEEGFDLAIRIGTMRDSSLIARKLANMPFIVCAAPEYLQQRGTPGHPSALATHECLLDQNSQNTANWTFTRGGLVENVRVQGQYQTNAPKALAELAIGGLGIARLPHYVIGDALKDGRLVRLFADYALGDTGVYALYPPNRHLTGRVRALIDHLAQHIHRDAHVP